MPVNTMRAFLDGLHQRLRSVVLIVIVRYVSVSPSRLWRKKVCSSSVRMAGDVPRYLPKFLKAEVLTSNVSLARW